jgi:hypothetical protein
MKKMSYYQRIEQAQETIKLLIRSGRCTLEDIKRYVFEEMQLGDKFVEKYVNSRIEGKNAEVVDAGIIQDVKVKRVKVVKE